MGKERTIDDRKLETVVWREGGRALHSAEFVALDRSGKESLGSTMPIPAPLSLDDQRSIWLRTDDRFRDPAILEKQPWPATAPRHRKGSDGRLVLRDSDGQDLRANRSLRAGPAMRRITA